MQRPRPKNPKSATADEAQAFRKSADAVAEEAAAHPGAPAEVFCTDEHRLCLKPVLRSVWTPGGERPMALGHHRFQWLTVTALVGPAMGDTAWYLADTVSKPLFAGPLDAFAREVGAGPHRRVVLLLDDAGWHILPNLVVSLGGPPITSRVDLADAVSS